jgi:NAD(P)-dependent dehydrogenase (short-subunit alcohol dehydrogenase family)
MAIITGGSRGLGPNTAVNLARRGDPGKARASHPSIIGRLLSERRVLPETMKPMNNWPADCSPILTHRHNVRQNNQ